MKEQTRKPDSIFVPVETVRVLLVHGADVTARDDTHSTPLHLTSSVGCSEIAQLLIEHGADVNALDGNHMTPLHLVFTSVSVNTGGATLVTARGRTDVEEQNFFSSFDSNFGVKIAQLLLKHGADVTAQNNTHTTPLHLALSSGVPEIVQLLIEHGADINTPDGDHKMPLHLARSPDIVRLLIKNGADVNALDGDHSTPLHLASSSKSLETVRLLIEHGADVNARDGSDKTPLHLLSHPLASHPVGAKSEYDPITPITPESTESTESPESPKSPESEPEFEFEAPPRRRFAFRYRWTIEEAAHVLIQHGADVNARDETYSTPLHVAASSYVRGSLKVVRLLLKHGANVDAKDDRGRTPLKLASERGNSKIVEFLVKYV